MNDKLNVFVEICEMLTRVMLIGQDRFNKIEWRRNKKYWTVKTKHG